MTAALATPPLDLEQYRPAWQGQPWRGYRKCSACGEIANCAGRTAHRQTCLLCFAGRAAAEARRTARRARRAARRS